MGFFASCGRCTLILLNLIFVLVSFGVIAAGVILKFFPGRLFEFLFDGVRDSVPFDLPETVNDLNLVPIVDNIGLALIIIGVVLFCFCFMACCGACCRWKLLLIMFCIVMVLLMVAIGTVGGLFLTRDSSLNNQVKRHLVQRVHEDYQGPTSQDIFTLSINLISYRMNCCAIAGPDDFDENADWTTQTFQGRTFRIDTSPACCRKEYFQNGRLDICAAKPFSEDRVHMQGCYTDLMDLVQEQRRWGILALVLVLVFLAVEVIFSIILIKDISDSASRIV